MKHAKKKKEKEKKREKETGKARKDKSKRARATAPDFQKALEALEAILRDFPQLLSELLTIIERLDRGEAAVVQGIKHDVVRRRMKRFLEALALKKVAKGTYEKPRALQATSLLERMHQLLAPSSSAKDAAMGAPAASASGSTHDDDNKEISDESIEPQRKQREGIIGPTLPHTMAAPLNLPASEGADSSDEEVIGPAMPGSKGYRRANPKVEAEVAKRALEIEESLSAGAQSTHRSTEVKREAWMTVMPETGILKDSMGGNAPVPKPSKQPAFRSRQPAEPDQSWFDAPEDRERANRAKIDMQLLGYVREENKDRDNSRRKHDSLLSIESTKASTHAEEPRHVVDRGPSLLEQYAEEQKKETSKKRKSSSLSTWDRERDLVVRKGVSKADADELINASKSMGSRFTTPKLARQFL